VGRFLFVCLGGAAGTAARYLMGLGAQRVFGTAFPWGTLAVNVIGSFLITVIMVLGLEKQMITADTRVVLTAGVMGGFTTYSSFNFEMMRFFREGAVGMGLVYMGVTLAGCLAAGAAGLLASRLVAG
jgi:CrcB protein